MRTTALNRPVRSATPRLCNQVHVRLLNTPGDRQCPPDGGKRGGLGAQQRLYGAQAYVLARCVPHVCGAGRQTTIHLWCSPGARVRARGESAR
jgi:hypothetical protein